MQVNKQKCHTVLILYVYFTLVICGHIDKLLWSKLACEFTVHEVSIAIRNVAADTKFVTTKCWCDEHSGYSLFSAALFVSPYRKQAPYSDLRVVQVKSPVWDTLSSSLQGLIYKDSSDHKWSEY